MSIDDTDRIEIRARYEPWSGKIAFYVFDRHDFVEHDNEGHAYGKHVATNITMEPCLEGHQTDPILHINEEDAQKLINDLWEAGIRPNEIYHKDDLLNAMNGHLEDMRAIVFNKLKVAKPNKKEGV